MQELEARISDLEKQLATERAQAKVDRALAEEAPFVHPVIRELANSRVVALAAEKNYSQHRVDTAIKKFLATSEIQNLLASINYAQQGAAPTEQQQPAKSSGRVSLSEMLADIKGGAKIRISH